MQFGSRVWRVWTNCTRYYGYGDINKQGLFVKSLVGVDANDTAACRLLSQELQQDPTRRVSLDLPRRRSDDERTSSDDGFQASGQLSCHCTIPAIWQLHAHYWCHLLASTWLSICQLLGDELSPPWNKTICVHNWPSLLLAYLFYFCVAGSGSGSGSGSDNEVSDDCKSPRKAAGNGAAKGFMRKNSSLQWNGEPMSL